MNVRGTLVIASAISFVSALTAFGIFKAIRAERSASPVPPNVQVASILISSRQHVTAGENHPAYISNPPTSGSHYDAATMAVVSKGQPIDEALVALLERG